ncbi:MAG: AIR synthase-related protein [Candidatus Cryptobacteroides sp.]
MKSKHTALFSRYVIDGIRQDVTPAELLEECMMPSDADMSETSTETSENETDVIWDESLDLSPESPYCSEDDFPGILETVTQASSPAQDRPFELLYPDSFTRCRIAAALIDCLWIEGEFRLEDLRLWADWSWNTEGIGRMAAFYNSVRSASEYIYGLGAGIMGYGYEDSEGECVNSYFPTLAAYADSADAEDEDIADKDWEEDDMAPERQWTVGGPECCIGLDRDIWMGDTRKCSAVLKVSGELTSFLVYVPFDTCQFRLGGSLLSACTGVGGGAGVALEDPDYFIDCFEVVRDLVEDGVVLSSRTVCDGGLAVAAKKLSASTGLGISLNVNGLSRAYNDTDRMKLLFAEVPGVLLQFDEADADYVDAQFLLQDVAYYRVGTVSADFSGVRLVPRSNGIERIIASLNGEF